MSDDKKLNDSKDVKDTEKKPDTSEQGDNTESADTAETNDDTDDAPEQQSSIVDTIRSVVLGVIVLVLIAVGIFAWAVNTGRISTEQVAMLNEELGLYKLPLVGNGKYFEVPEGVEWPPKPEPEPEPEPEAAKEPEAEKKSEAAKETEKPKREEKLTEVKIDRKAIEEQRIKREAEEKKRVTRLARIYENMKPEQAANALINVDWDTTVLILQRMSEDAVAQILAKMPPEDAAQITEMLYAGTQRRVTTPSDSMRGEPVTPSERVTARD